MSEKSEKKGDEEEFLENGEEGNGEEGDIENDGEGNLENDDLELAVQEERQGIQEAPKKIPPIEFEWSDINREDELKDRELAKESHLIIPETPLKRLYYTPSQISQHNSERDCWVSVLGKVFDITSLIACSDGWSNFMLGFRDRLFTNSGALTKPLTTFAGQDLSHWFDSNTGDVIFISAPIPKTIDNTFFVVAVETENRSRNKNFRLPCAPWTVCARTSA